MNWTRPIYITGAVVNGVLEIPIDTNDANLSIGHWQMCIDSLTVTLQADIKTHVTLSTNLLHSSAGHPAPLHVFLIKGSRNDQLSLLSTRKKSFVDFANASYAGNILKLFFRDEQTKGPCGAFTLYGVVLLRRVE